MYPVSFPCGCYMIFIYKKGVSPYCFFPGCIVTWAWSMAEGQYMVEWLLTGASPPPPPNKDIDKIDEFQINEINVDLRTSGFDNEVLSVDACAVWWERESFYCLPRISVVTWHREPRFQCGSARTCSIWNSSIGRVSSVGRAPARQSGSCRFKPALVNLSLFIQNLQRKKIII